MEVYICHCAYWREAEAEMLAWWSGLRAIVLSDDGRGQRRHVRLDRRDRRKWSELRRIETLESTSWGVRQQHRSSATMCCSAR